MARAKKPRKRTLAELPAEPDPRAPIDGALLVTALQPIRKDLEKDLLARAKASPAITAALKKRHATEREEERTADDFASWQRRFVEQVAAAWILSCVFVRTLEDRGLLAQRRIAGPGALDAQRTFLQLAPSLSEREYLLTTFREMARLPAAASLFDRHDPVWMLAPSAEGARALLAFFRTGGDEAPALRFGQLDTRFLGDLYQDLNENVRKRYALLQTPDFIERFILDRTLEPAIETFGLDDSDLCDPTCGSGHFLLGAFQRFFAHVRRAKPALSPREAAVQALDKVYGADINPYAVAIAKLRLTLAFLDAAGITRLVDAPQLPLHVAVADSLLYNPQHGQRALFHQDGVDAAAWERRAFDFEDEAEARAVLHREYAAVVGNPPYITVKDSKLRDRYRDLYASAFRSYSLGVPFCERFFQLARPDGRVGQITANSFMKREFGKKLIEDYLPTVDLDLIVNTSGAYIPGHGTPTVLLFGAHRRPTSDEVLAVLAKRGEPATPEDPAQGLVWSAIAEHWGDVGYEDDYVSVARVERAGLAGHPWSLAGGGAAGLKELLESRAAGTLGDLVEAIGRTTHTGEDQFYFMSAGAAARNGVAPERTVPLIKGEQVRDWSLTSDEISLFPYRGSDATPVEPTGSREACLYWSYRTVLRDRQDYGQKIEARGLHWFEHSMFFPERFLRPLGITFAEVATHNHFVLDRGGKVFKQTAPIIKLPATATEEDHLALLAYLNSSTACFLLRQLCHSKGAQGVNEGHKSEEWEQFTQHSGTAVAKLPLPKDWQSLATLGRACVEHATALEAVMPGHAVERWAKGEHGGYIGPDFGTPPRDMLQRMVALQEELDWEVYSLFDLVPEEHAIRLRHGRTELFGKRQFERMDTRPHSPSPAELAPGHRAFEHVLARRPTAWFSRNGYEEPSDPGLYGDPMASLLRARIEAIERVPEIRVVEQPEFKRRWEVRDADAEGRATIEAWALDLAERVFDETSAWRASRIVVAWFEQDRERSREVATAYFDSDVFEWLCSALAADAVPYLAALRYTEPGLDKHAAWERTWDLQRREDAGEKVGAIPVPPKYAQGDFRSSSSWRLRGKLDVPKERFISYPGCASDEDGEPVYGWAGWDHAQRAQALVALYQDRKTREGWQKDRLTPMLAGVLELLPWLKQWHDVPRPDFDQTDFEAYDAFLDAELREHGLTRDDLRAWRPAEKKGRRK